MLSIQVLMGQFAQSYLLHRLSDIFFIYPYFLIASICFKSHIAYVLEGGGVHRSTQQALTSSRQNITHSTRPAGTDGISSSSY